MNTKQHTPAPWHIYRAERTLIIMPLVVNDWSHSCERIAEVTTYHGYEHEDAEANAALIAAAPDLLEALDDIYSYLEQSGKKNTPPAIRAQQALAKARPNGKGGK